MTKNPIIKDETIPELSMDLNPLVSVRHLKKHFPVSSGILGQKTEMIRAVDDVSFTIPEGQTFGLVGESGSGKTTVGKSMLRLIEPTEGTVILDGQDLSKLSNSQLKKQRKNMQIVYQDPTSSLNPRKRIKNIIMDPLKIHGVGTHKERLDRMYELLDIINLPQDYGNKYPTALSGGQKQRVGIARAVALNPEFIVLDEPTSALDVSVQAQIIDLFDNLQNKFNLTYLFISHDLSLVQKISDRIGVMYLGNIVEIGDTDSVFHNPQHPYTRALLSAIPTINEEDEQIKPEEITLEGDIPDPREKPSGCPFHSRCPLEFDECSSVEPPMYKIHENHYSRCLLQDEEYSAEDIDWIAR